jgi:aminodeoxyfutalosine deaminase
MTSPRIELHVHFEGTVGPAALAEVARRNNISVPALTELEALYAQRDLKHVGQVWRLIIGALRTADDFRRIVVAYAGEARRHGAVYIEGIFSPVEAARQISMREVFRGYCEGADQARDEIGIEVRLTPDITRGASVDEAERVMRLAIAHRDDGVVGLGLGGRDDLSPEPYVPLFAAARDAGIPAVPHAGDFSDGNHLRRDLALLQPVRIRHGIRAADHPDILSELAERGVVLDVCPTSNVRLRTVRSLAQHPLPRLIAAGVRCSISTDDPALFGTDLSREHEIASSLGLSEGAAFQAALAGALCDASTRQRLATLAPPGAGKDGR